MQRVSGVMEGEDDSNLEGECFMDLYKYTMCHTTLHCTGNTLHQFSS